MVDVERERGGAWTVDSRAEERPVKPMGREWAGGSVGGGAEGGGGAVEVGGGALCGSGGAIEVEGGAGAEGGAV